VATVILAVGDRPLRDLCEAALAHAGHVTIHVERGLELLTLKTRLRGDVVLADASRLGRDAARAGAVPFANRMVGLGFGAPGVLSLALPLQDWQVVDAVERLSGATLDPRAGLALEPGRRVARANGREVALSRTEYQLLEALLTHRGRELSLDEAMEAIWGAGEWSRNVGLLRAHMRNLRLKLAQIGLANAVRSLRGRGYALAV
jgi:DNA-binding response OmpR family regulator